MAQFGTQSILLSIMSFLTSLQSEKILSELKKCGDLECESLMIRAQASQDYMGPDCRYLNFKVGEEVLVYFKLSGKREDLWAGSKGKEFGYFPRGTVKIEDVYVSEEVEVPTKETDFVCLDGGAYTFENEDSILQNSNEETEYPYPDKEVVGPIPIMPEGELLKHTSTSSQKEQGFSSTPANESRETQAILNDFQEVAGKPEMSKNNKEDAFQQDTPKSSWAVSDFGEWFGIGSQEEKGTSEPITETFQEDSFRSRKIALSDENSLKESDGKDESENGEVGWFESRFAGYFSFDRRDSVPGLLDKDSDTQQEGLNMGGDSEPQTFLIETDSVTEEQEKKASENEGAKSNWFSLGLENVFNSGQNEKGKLTRNEEQTEERQEEGESSVDTQPLNNRETDSYTGTEETKETVKSGIDDIQSEEKSEIPDTGGLNNESPVTGWLLSNFHNLLNFKITTGETVLHSTMEAGEHYSMDQESAVESQMKSTEDEDKPKEAGSRSDESDTADDAESSNPIPEKTHYTNTVLGTELRKDSEAQIITALHAKEEEEEHLSTSVSQEDTKKLVSETPVQSSGNIPCHEDESTFWMLQSLNTTEICSIVKHVLAAVATLLQKLMEALPEDLKPGHDLHGFPWEMVFCAAIVGLFTALLFVCRTCQSIKSRLYLGRERQLANKVAELVEDKCSVLENLSLCKQQYEELELSLKDASLVKESSKTTDLEATSEKLNRSNSILQNDIKNLEKELEEEKSKRLQQDDLLAEIQRRIQSLENEAKAIKSQTEEARTTLKVFQINKSRLETSLQNAMDERSHLQESNQQLFQEAEGWGERLIELNEQTKMYELSKKDMEEALNNKESQVKSLTECLLKMKDWGSELGGDNDNEDNSWEEEMKNETENGDYLEDLQKRTVKRLIYAAKLNASLKSLETERNQIYSKLSDEVKAKEELADRIEHLQHEQGSLRSENSHFESEVQKLQQKLKVMTEMYQENELKLHRKLTVEEKDRLQKEEKLSKVDEKINFAAEELNSYRTRAKDLEEELEKSIRSYQSQITSHEKKAHDNWLTARAAERHLNDIRKENAHNRQNIERSWEPC